MRSFVCMTIVLFMILFGVLSMDVLRMQTLREMFREPAQVKSVVELSRVDPNTYKADLALFQMKTSGLDQVKNALTSLKGAKEKAITNATLNQLQTMDNLLGARGGDCTDASILGLENKCIHTEVSNLIQNTFSLVDVCIVHAMYLRYMRNNLAQNEITQASIKDDVMEYHDTIIKVRDAVRERVHSYSDMDIDIDQYYVFDHGTPPPNPYDEFASFDNDTRKFVVNTLDTDMRIDNLFSTSPNSYTLSTLLQTTPTDDVVKEFCMAKKSVEDIVEYTALRNLSEFVKHSLVKHILSP